MEITTKTQTSQYIELLARLIVSDASFLTLREKIIFHNFLLTDYEGNPFENEKSFTEHFLSLTITDISLAVKRVFSRARWNPHEVLNKVRISQKIMEVQKIKSTCYLDTDFPAMLLEMKDPPFMLFYRGNPEILSKPCISVVGTRRAFPQALKAASDFSKAACDDGFCVISGLAFGIDAASHSGALLSKTPATCAVLPSGIDIITPHSHTRLAAKILEKGGLIISEYLPGTPSVQFRYVQRNRIVAALSPAAVVIQAQAGSGAMITADLALGYNREVLFHKECFTRQIPGKIGASEAGSPKAFVSDGAKVVSGWQEFKKEMFMD